MKHKNTQTTEQKEKVFYKKLLTAIRRNFSLQSPHVKNCREAKKTKNELGLVMYECAHCKNRFAQSHTEVDHIVAVGKSPETVDELLVAIKNTITHDLQLLCKPCHKKKTTKEDNAKIKKMKTPRLKKVS